MCAPGVAVVIVTLTEPVKVPARAGAITGVATDGSARFAAGCEGHCTPNNRETAQAIAANPGKKNIAASSSSMSPSRPRLPLAHPHHGQMVSRGLSQNRHGGRDASSRYANSIPRRNHLPALVTQL